MTATVAAADTLACWVALSQVPRLGAARFRLLEAHFDGDLTRAWRAPTRELRASGIGGAAAQGIAAARAATSPDAELERLAQYGVRALTWQDDAYPARMTPAPLPTGIPIPPKSCPSCPSVSKNPHQRSAKIRKPRIPIIIIPACAPVL